ncbi:hypothetical protein [Heliorestis convoluta]|uniref:Uncharacterized protein n=1 Tax=Heliorestis convoluta TaxID=356322 RepID=A0A5Q2N5P0_9FIRM|nr:hypothetical protein [Heliorestis convoluta]QGG48946.1 hypothetical protein FTV88_2857 [Heliorestis convoluta]
MSHRCKRTLLLVEGSAFEKKEGDSVYAGELLGYSGARSIKAPYHGVIEAIAFHHEAHTVAIYIKSRNVEKEISS